MFTKRFFISQCILPLPTTINICTLFYPRIIFFTFCRMKKLWCKHSSTEIPMINTKICAKNKVFNKSNLSIYNPQNEKMRVPETKGLKNPQIPKTKRLLFIQTHKRQRKPKQPVSLPFVLYIQFKSNIIFTANQTDSLINVILVNMDITKV